jgi:hypothetical protein
MFTYTTRRNTYGDLTGDGSSANLTLGDTLMNMFDREIVTMKQWNFREKTHTASTVASQQFYNLPAQSSRIYTPTVTIGTTKYTPTEITTREEWDYLNQSTSTTSDTPEFFFVFGGQYGFYPTPSSATASAITVPYLATHRDLSVADYTTGTITSIANGATTVTGSGTTWTVKMAGRYIRFTDSDTANTGDGKWYEISSVTSATVLELKAPYQGTSIAAGTAAYTIGQVSIIPEDFQNLSMFRACELYFTGTQPDEKRSQMFKTLYAEGINRMQRELGAKTV